MHLNPQRKYFVFLAFDKIVWTFSVILSKFHAAKPRIESDNPVKLVHGPGIYIP